MTDRGQEAGTLTQPVTDAAGSRRRLVRRMDGKIIAGVANGLGAYTGVDPVIWRIGFVVTCFISGIGLIAYLAGWLIMPRSDDPLEDVPPIDATRTRTWIGIVALVLGVALLAHEVLPLQGGLILGLLLIGIGIALWTGPDAPSRAPHASGLTPTADPPQDHPQPTSAHAGGEPTSDGTPAAEIRSPQRPSPPPPPRRPRQRSILGRLTLGALALAIGGALLADELGWVALRLQDVMALSLVVVGAGLVVGAWWGRARWLIVPGAVLVIFLAGALALPDLSFRDGVGEAHYVPTRTDELRDEYRLLAGELRVDLSRLDLRGRRTVVRARVLFGELRVFVPEDVPVRVRGRVQGGELHLLGKQQQGWGVSDQASTGGPRSAGLLDIVVEAGFGEAWVIPEPPTVPESSRDIRFDFGRR